MTNEEAEILQKAWTPLSFGDRRLLVMRFVRGWTLKQIGDRFHVTRERIRQKVSRALRRARHNSELTLDTEEVQLSVEAAKSYTHRQNERKRLPMYDYLRERDKLDAYWRAREVMEREIELKRFGVFEPDGRKKILYPYD